VIRAFARPLHCCRSQWYCLKANEPAAVFPRPVVSFLSTSFTPTRRSPRLADAGVLRQISLGRRNRAFEAPEIVDAFNALERRLVSLADDTHESAPSRKVPARR
jgi:hypothetical protein